MSENPKESFTSDPRLGTDTDVSTDVARGTDSQSDSCNADVLTHAETDGLTIVTQTDDATDSHSIDTVAPVSQSQDPSLSTQVRSRFGRIIKPVDRLIQTMLRQDITYTRPSMHSVYRSVFPVFHG